MLTLVPSQANHSSHGHVERLKHDPRPALWAKRDMSAAHSVLQPSIARRCHCQRKELRHQQNGPCTCHCRDQRSVNSSSAVFTRIDGQKNVGCLRSLESDLLRNAQNSCGSSRSVLDPSWFGLRAFPCVKGSYFRLDFKGPAPSLRQAEHEKSRRQHTVQQQTTHDGKLLFSCFSTKSVIQNSHVDRYLGSH